ncbi:Integral membrane protein [Madurella fahalii]|uniref:Integral membrane protein n=1 Tax=Madurella fahalii TaxID=1157608 RepID=A0ABQ0FZ17_9PEZI
METTLFPVQALPSCLPECGPMFDVNGACVPPGAEPADAGTYSSCFCNDPRLAPFSTGTAGVCDNACATNPADLGLIQGWYRSFCENAVDNGNTQPTTSSRPGNAVGSNNGGGGGTWIDNHYQWVIFLVIMIVAIVGIWVGACIWRRRYLRKKDLQYALGTNLARATESGRVVPNTSSAGSIHAPAAGMFDPAPISSARVFEEKPKKKWTVMGRT